MWPEKDAQRLTADITRSTRFRFWRWLIRFIGVIGAAPLPHALSTGMGSGIGTPRRTAGPMGPARLEEQTRIAVAQSRRVLGRAVAPATTVGGRNGSGLSVWAADGGQKQRIHGRGCVLARARDRS